MIFTIMASYLTIMEMTEKKSLLLWTRVKPKENTYVKSIMAGLKPTIQRT